MKAIISKAPLMGNCMNARYWAFTLKALAVLPPDGNAWAGENRYDEIRSPQRFEKRKVSEPAVGIRLERKPPRLPILATEILVSRLDALDTGFRRCEYISLLKNHV